jgi:hypothetical protein
MDWRWVFLLSLSLATTGWAQDTTSPKPGPGPRDRASLRLSYDDTARFTDGNDPGLDRASLRVTSLELKTGAPLLLGESFKLLFSLDLARSDLNFRSAGGFQDLVLYVLEPGLAAIVELNEDWSVFAKAGPRLASDLISIESDDIGLSALFVANRALSPNLRINLGIFARLGFGNDLIVPAVGLSWDISPQWRLDLQAPAPRLTWSPSRLLSLSAEFGFLPGQWHARIKDPQSGQRVSGFLDRRGSRASLSADVALGGGWRLRLALSFNFLQGLEFRDGSREVFDSPLRESLGLSIGLAWQ